MLHNTTFKPVFLYVVDALLTPAEQTQTAELQYLPYLRLWREKRKRTPLSPIFDSAL